MMLMESSVCLLEGSSSSRRCAVRGGHCSYMPGGAHLFLFIGRRSLDVVAGTVLAFGGQFETGSSPGNHV